MNKLIVPGIHWLYTVTGIRYEAPNSAFIVCTVDVVNVAYQTDQALCSGMLKWLIEDGLLAAAVFQGGRIMLISPKEYSLDIATFARAIVEDLDYWLSAAYEAGWAEARLVGIGEYQFVNEVRVDDAMSGPVPAASMRPFDVIARRCA